MRKFVDAKPRQRSHRQFAQAISHEFTPHPTSARLVCAAFARNFRQLTSITEIE
jgi:hypothetical protein